MIHCISDYFFAPSFHSVISKLKTISSIFIINYTAATIPALGVEFRIQVPSIYLSDILCVQPCSAIVDSDMMTQDLLLKHVWSDSSMAEKTAAGAFDAVTAEYDGDSDHDSVMYSGFNLRRGVRDNKNENDYENDGGRCDEASNTAEGYHNGEFRTKKGLITREATGKAGMLHGKHRKSWGFLPPLQVFSDLLRGAEISQDRSRFVTVTVV